jgi:plasmid stabilization system protein ParE
MHVSLLDQAKSDLLEIGAYYRELGGIPLARTMLERIKGPVLKLGQRPEIGPPYELAPGVRRLVVAKGTFLVFYRVRTAVEVLHIRRAERSPAEATDLAAPD